MRLTKKAGLAAITLLALLSTVHIVGLAQSLVTAEVDRTSLSTDESLILTIRASVDGGSSSSPTLPALDGFRLDGSSSGRSITLANGALTIAATYQYRLTPTRPGDLVIGPVTVEINGQVYATDPISISVTQGTGQPQPPPGSNPSLPGFPNLPGLPNLPSLRDWIFSPPGASGPSVPVNPGPALDSASIPADLIGQDLFVESLVSNPTPYQGEGLLHTFRFYQAVELFGDTDYDPPSFTGFWHEQVGEHQVFGAQAAGRDYRVTEIQTLLFPTVVGAMEIEPASLSTPDSFFQEGQLLETRPLQLDVRPLPAGAPAGFRGAVGQFNLSTEVDKIETRVNDTVTYKLTLTGSGNLETVPDPVWSEGPEWRTFKTQSDTETWVENGRRVGSRTYERLLIPTVPGELVLPGVEYVYFDPQSETYETARTEPILVQVAPDGSAAGSAASGGADSGGAVGLTAPDTAGGIRPNKTAASTAAGSRAPLPLQAGYWLFWLVPLLLLAGHFAWQTLNKRRLANSAARRSEPAARKSQRALLAGQRSPREAHAGAILLGYLEEKLDRPVSGLTEGRLADLLQQHGAEAGQVERVVALLHRSEASRYAPGAASSESGRDLLDVAGQLVEDLEKNLR